MRRPGQLDEFRLLIRCDPGQLRQISLADKYEQRLAALVEDKLSTRALSQLQRDSNQPYVDIAGPEIAQSPNTSKPKVNRLHIHTAFAQVETTAPALPVLSE